MVTANVLEIDMGTRCLGLTLNFMLKPCKIGWKLRTIFKWKTPVCCFLIEITVNWVEFEFNVRKKWRRTVLIKPDYLNYKVMTRCAQLIHQ